MLHMWRKLAGILDEEQLAMKDHRQSVAGPTLYEEFKDIKGYSEFVTRRRTDITIAKRKRTKRQTTIYKTLHTKLIYVIFYL